MDIDNASILMETMGVQIDESDIRNLKNCLIAILKNEDCNNEHSRIVDLMSNYISFLLFRYKKVKIEPINSEDHTSVILGLFQLPNVFSEYLVMLIERILEMIVDPKASFYYTLGIVKLLIGILKKNKNKLYFCEYLIWRAMDYLCLCGDYEYQMNILELVIRAIPRIHSRAAAINFFPGHENLQEALMNVNYKEPRSFLNLINDSYGTVFSLQAKRVFTGGILLKPPEKYSHTDGSLWIDFNMVTKRLTIQCAAPSTSSAPKKEFIIIDDSIVEAVNISKNYYSMDVTISLSGPLSAKLEATRSLTDNVRNVNIELSFSEKASNLIQYILPEIFPQHPEIKMLDVSIDVKVMSQATMEIKSKMSLSNWNNDTNVVIMISRRSVYGELSSSTSNTENMLLDMSNNKTSLKNTMFAENRSESEINSLRESLKSYKTSGNIEKMCDNKLKEQSVSGSYINTSSNKLIVSAAKMEEVESQKVQENVRSFNDNLLQVDVIPTAKDNVNVHSEKNTIYNSSAVDINLPEAKNNMDVITVNHAPPVFSKTSSDIRSVNANNSGIQSPTIITGPCDNTCSLQNGASPNHLNIKISSDVNSESAKFLEICSEQESFDELKVCRRYVKLNINKTISELSQTCNSDENSQLLEEDLEVMKILENVENDQLLQVDILSNREASYNIGARQESTLTVILPTQQQELQIDNAQLQTHIFKNISFYQNPRNIVSVEFPSDISSQGSGKSVVLRSKTDMINRSNELEDIGTSTSNESDFELSAIVDKFTPSTAYFTQEIDSSIDGHSENSGNPNLHIDQHEEIAVSEYYSFQNAAQFESVVQDSNSKLHENPLNCKDNDQNSKEIIDCDMSNSTVDDINVEDNCNIREDEHMFNIERVNEKVMQISDDTDCLSSIEHIKSSKGIVRIPLKSMENLTNLLGKGEISMVSTNPFQFRDNVDYMLKNEEENFPVKNNSLRNLNHIENTFIDKISVNAIVNSDITSIQQYTTKSNTSCASIHNNNIEKSECIGMLPIKTKKTVSDKLDALSPIKQDVTEHCSSSDSIINKTDEDSNTQENCRARTLTTKTLKQTVSDKLEIIGSISPDMILHCSRNHSTTSSKRCLVKVHSQLIVPNQENWKDVLMDIHLQSNGETDTVEQNRIKRSKYKLENVRNTPYLFRPRIKNAIYTDRTPNQRLNFCGSNERRKHTNKVSPASHSTQLFRKRKQITKNKRISKLGKFSIFSSHFKVTGTRNDILKMKNLLHFVKENCGKFEEFKELAENALNYMK